MELITRNPDLNRLLSEGYEIQVSQGHAIIHSVPYLNDLKQPAFGILVCPLVMGADDRTAYNADSDHTVAFAGGHPRNVDGTELLAIKNSSVRQEIIPGLWIDHRFSARPNNNYRDHYHKITAYIKLMREPLLSLGFDVDGRTYNSVQSQGNVHPFTFTDTNSARAGMTAINSKLVGQQIAIIGLGGTGSYILDFVAKTYVEAIHVFDGDVMLSHNYFRAPGAPANEQRQKAINKAEYHANTYSNMHTGIVIHPYDIDETQMSKLDGLNFVFLSMDGSARKQGVIDYLKSRQIPFIDVGLNMRVIGTSLRGQVRTSLITPSSAEALSHYLPSLSETAQDKGVYESNAQIAEMNAFNACMAVISWKRHNGIYDSLDMPDHSIYKVRNNRLVTYED